MIEKKWIKTVSIVILVLALILVPVSLFYYYSIFVGLQSLAKMFAGEEIPVASMLEGYGKKPVTILLYGIDAGEFSEGTYRDRPGNADTIAPVSYTHLAELIKARRHRMLRALLVVMVLVELLIIGGMRYWATPVSYTHLDVYKRQIAKRYATIKHITVSFLSGFNTLASFEVRGRKLFALTAQDIVPAHPG